MASRNARSAAAKKGAGRSAAKKSVVPPTRQTGTGSATGVALIDSEGSHEIPSGEDAGSKVPIDGGEPPADLIGDPGQPRGAQAEPAVFTSNGEVDTTQMPSPTGPVGPSAAAGVNSVEDYQARRQEIIDHHEGAEQRRADLRRKAIDEPTVNRLGRAELQAIGQARGYQLPEIAGARVTREAFLRAQENDDTLDK